MPALDACPDEIIGMIFGCIVPTGSDGIRQDFETSKYLNSLSLSCRYRNIALDVLKRETYCGAIIEKTHRKIDHTCLPVHLRCPNGTSTHIYGGKYLGYFENIEVDATFNKRRGRHHDHPDFSACLEGSVCSVAPRSVYRLFSDGFSTVHSITAKEIVINLSIRGYMPDKHDEVVEDIYRELGRFGVPKIVVRIEKGWTVEDRLWRALSVLNCECCTDGG